LSKFKSTFAAAGLGLLLSASASADDTPDLSLCISEIESVSGPDEVVQTVNAMAEFFDIDVQVESYSLNEQNGTLSHVFYNMQVLGEDDGFAYMLDNRSKQICVVTQESYSKFKPLKPDRNGL
jgi:hypothetical protein